jgi:Protein of unknown function (DUF3105)
MDERGTGRGATGSGGGRPSGRSGGRTQGGSGGRPQGGSGGRPQGGSGRQGGSARQGASGRPQAATARKPAAGKKVTGSARKAAARRRQERRRRAIIASVVAGVVVIAVVAVALVASRGNGGGTTTTAGYGHVATFGGLSRNHTSSPVHYAQNPPVGGDHNPVWQNCGYYAQPIHNENGVHSLEHGAVWITYQPNLPKDQVDRLAAIGRGQPFVLVSPYPGLPAPVVASAWGVQEWFHSANDSGLNDFVSKYRQGPQTPEPGALCTNGTGTPR